MGSCLPCCKCTAFFGIIFYVLMGVIVLTQSEFLKFDIPSSKDSGITCFLVAIIELLIFVGIVVYEKRQQAPEISRENYLNLESERNRRPRESTFKGIAMGDLKVMREERERNQQENLI